MIFIQLKNLIQSYRIRPKFQQQSPTRLRKKTFKKILTGLTNSHLMIKIELNNRIPKIKEKRNPQKRRKKSTVKLYQNVVILLNNTMLMVCAKIATILKVEQRELQDVFTKIESFTQRVCVRIVICQSIIRTRELQRRSLMKVQEMLITHLAIYLPNENQNLHRLLRISLILMITMCKLASQTIDSGYLDGLRYLLDDLQKFASEGF